MTWRSRITQIRSLDEVPQRPPDQRNVEPRGYVRLRWKVGVGEYLECYEHRLVAGFPDAHVHHHNEVKDDNSRSNLMSLSNADHQAAHALVDDRRIAQLYLSGLSTQKVAQKIGCDPATAWRSLRRSGTPTRTRREAALLNV